MTQPLTQPHSPTHSPTPFVIAVIGGNNVGKTILSRNLSEAATISQSSNQNCNIFCKEVAEKGRIIHYYDYSALSLKLIEDLATESPQMLLALFRDSVSYGQLYEFFENVTAQTEGGSQELKAYWEDFENLVLVYSQVQGQKEVQIDQLFGILIEEIRNFNRTATIKQFVLKRDPDNHQYLRQLIEKTLPAFEVQAQASEALEKREDETEKEEESESTKHEAEIDHVGEQEKEEELNEIKAEIKKLEQQEIKKEEKLSLQNQRDYVSQKQIDKNIIALQESKVEHTPILILPEPFIQLSIPYLAGDQGQTIPIEVQQRYLQVSSSPNENEQLQQNPSLPLQQQQPKIQTVIQVEPQLWEVVTIQKKEEDLPQLQLRVQGLKALPTQNEIVAQRVQKQQIDKEQQHYQEVYNRLMQKITSEDIQDAHKDSYKNLFEEFRRTSKEESKISKELHQYWKQKIEKLEEQEEDQSLRDERQAEEEEEEEEEEDQFPPDEQEESSLQTGQQSALHPKDERSHTQKQLLKPQTGYQKRPPHRQKSTSEVKPCMCQIM